MYCIPLCPVAQDWHKICVLSVLSFINQLFYDFPHYITKLLCVKHFGQCSAVHDKLFKPPHSV